MKSLLVALFCSHTLLATTVTIVPTNSATSTDTSSTATPTPSATIISNQTAGSAPGGTTSITNTSGNTINNVYPDLYLNATGNGIAAWACTPTTTAGYQVLASVYNVTTATWSAPTNLGAGSAPVVSMDGAGNAFVVWVDNFQIFVNIYTAATASWGTSATELSTTSTGTSGNSNTYPSLSVNSNGVAAVAWLAYADGSTIPTIYMSAYDGTNWSSAPVLVTPSGSLDIVSPPVISIDNIALAPGPVTGQLTWLDATEAGIVFAVQVQISD
ncbi:MAG: hypothetical protein JSS62_01175 [Verrucomicrobia bacterium]|nr:hypothetical protein [Verrucomicrobiota bacterium]MBS0646080.1 hypothetical protein [Verrucomicrobiota bacterium]